jgi:carboxymethylenebutenolidase
MIKNILKISGGILGVLAALILLLALSIPLAGIGSQERLDAVTNTSIPGTGGGPEVRAYVAKPPGAGPFPVVIMIHEFFGLNAAITSMADGLSEAGYIVVAPDTFRGSTSLPGFRARYIRSSTNNPAASQRRPRLGLHLD